jgi:hypothetical protein
MNLLALDKAIRAVAPIDGLGNDGLDNIRIDFKPEATQAEQDAAQAIVDNWVDPPVQDWKSFVDGAATVTGFYAQVAGSAMASLITGRMVRLAMGEEFDGASDPLIEVWNAAPPALDQHQRDALTALATTHGIPVTISDSDNTLTVA